jgi:hypothetical protein
MKLRGKLKGKGILLTEDPEIPGEPDVEVEINLLGEEEAFGMWSDRDDIALSTEWVRSLREAQWRR